MGLFGKKKEGQSEGSLRGVDIVRHPEKIDEIQGKYVLLGDSPSYDFLNKAINIMALKGWKCISIAVQPAISGLNVPDMYALMEKVN